MYDVTDKNSFKNVRNLIKQIEANADKSAKRVLVGHKCDEPGRVVTEEEGKKLAEEYNMVLFESSARTGKNVSEVFNHLVKEMMKEVDPEVRKKIEEEQAKKIMNILMKYISF